MPIEGLEPRIVALEVNDEWVKDRLEKNDKDHEELKIEVKGITQRLDKQNGTLPHLKETVGRLDTNIDKVECKVDKIQEDVFSVKEKVTKIDYKSRIVWAVVSSLVTALAAALVKLLG